jgi:hypothetical protein
LAHYLYGFQIIPVYLAGNITASIHHTFEDDIHQPLIPVTASLLEEGKGYA